MGPHEEFLELCALSTAGGLSEEERGRLEQHLAECSDCREAMKQFETIIDKDIPALAPELVRDIPEENPTWSAEKAKPPSSSGCPRNAPKTNNVRAKCRRLLRLLWRIH